MISPQQQQRVVLVFRADGAKKKREQERRARQCYLIEGSRALLRHRFFFAFSLLRIHQQQWPFLSPLEGLFSTARAFLLLSRSTLLFSLLAGK